LASGSLTPLSLAYLIEISFVINLAYHELNTFKLRDSIRRKSKDVLNPYNKMWDGEPSLLVEPEWGQLKSFHTGEDKAAWENKKIRWVYSKFIYSGLDRQITRLLLAMDILILLLCTLFASTSIGSIFPLPDQAWSILTMHAYLWWVGFCALVLSIAIPGFFMLIMRQCYTYAHGCPKDLNDDGTKGRLRQLSQAVLKKINAHDDLKLKNIIDSNQ